MAAGAGFNWVRVQVAVILAELLPILLLVAIVAVYGVIRKPDSLSPSEFAPLAGTWVGPIGGFLATLLFAWWAARRVRSRRGSCMARSSAWGRLYSISAWAFCSPEEMRFRHFSSSRTAAESSPESLVAGWRLRRSSGDS